jgi:aldose sugar dehydrogenase
MINISSNLLLFYIIAYITTTIFLPICINAQEVSDGVHEGDGRPTVLDPTLKVETIGTGFNEPTAMAFLGPDDILILEKKTGTVQRIINGEMLEEPILDVSVANKVERGMLGIAVTKNVNESKPVYVFLYFTESYGKEDGLDCCRKFKNCEEGNEPLGNRLYRYELVNNRLINPKLLLDLPAAPGPIHNGGVITIGPDGNIYVIIGNVNSRNTQTQNIKGTELPDGRGGILRVTQDGEVVDDKGILGDERPLSFYYAYGIRNSFGIDFDPVTGILWDTEVGNRENDEVNLVEAGFNSGFDAIQGMAPDDFNANKLVDFGGEGKYSNPEFTWNNTITPTAIVFLNSDKYGKNYKNDIFVGDNNIGNIYHFDMNDNRTGLSLKGSLKDKIADSHRELEENKDVIFGKGFGGIILNERSFKEFGAITDLEVGPYDGYLYILSYGQGKIFRIVPS